MIVDLERLLSESLAEPIEPEEREDLVARLRLQEELAEQVRALVLDAEEPLLEELP